MGIGDAEEEDKDAEDEIEMDVYQAKPYQTSILFSKQKPQAIIERIIDKFIDQVNEFDFDKKTQRLTFTIVEQLNEEDKKNEF